VALGKKSICSGVEKLKNFWRKKLENGCLVRGKEREERGCKEK
jgi:hypothetical protein